jgi:VCBS repeat-containing protein
MTYGFEDDIQRIAASMDHQQNSRQQDIPGITEQETQPEETIHIHYFPDAIVILKEEDQLRVVDSTPVLPQKTSMMPAYAFCCFSLLLIVSTLAFQLYCIVNPPAATIAILPKSQTVSMKGTLQVGRVLPPLTISQSQTTATTGKGHQNAKAATGTVTFYNGQFQSVFLPAGTLLTGASGVQILTDQDATIPAGNPPSYGQVSVSAYAISPGLRGNIPAYDINRACCATSVLAKNIQPFTGGQNERDFSIVSQQDIQKISTPLKAAVTQSMQGALQGQLKPSEQLQLLPCTPTVSSDYQVGAEATQLKVTVSQTCNAVAYSGQELATKATAFLSRQALQKTGTGYSLFGTVHVSVKQASVSYATTPLVFLSFSASGTWMYGLSHIAQQQIKHLVAGKTTQQALKMLETLPGIEQASIQITGFGDATRLPKTVAYIQLMLLAI